MRAARPRAKPRATYRVADQHGQAEQRDRGRRRRRSRRSGRRTRRCRAGTRAARTRCRRAAGRASAAGTVGAELTGEGCGPGHASTLGMCPVASHPAAGRLRGGASPTVRASPGVPIGVQPSRADGFAVFLRIRPFRHNGLRRSPAPQVENEGHIVPRGHLSIRRCAGGRPLVRCVTPHCGAHVQDRDLCTASQVPSLSGRRACQPRRTVGHASGPTRTPSFHGVT